MLTEATAAKKIKIQLKKNCLLKIETNFCSWQLAEREHYAKAYSIGRDSVDYHLIYFFNANLIKIFVPSWALQCDLFIRSSIMLKHLYCLNGFEFLTNPELHGRKFSVALSPLGGVFRNNTYIGNRLMWFFAFPSAYRTFKSVYDFARKGMIGMSLPKAKITCTIAGKRIGNSLFASNIRISTVCPLEAPLKWARCEEKELRINGFDFPNRQNRCLIDLDLLGQNGISSLTDDEWEAIKPVLGSRHQLPLERLRFMMDLILKKLTKGESWRPTPDRPDRSAQAFYYFLKKSGRWPLIKNLLFQSRNKTKRRRPKDSNSSIPAILFDQRPRNMKAREKDGDLLIRYGRWKTSNPEWAAIKTILERSFNHFPILRSRGRIFIDSILEKLGGGKTWSSIAKNNGISRTTLTRIYQILIRDGRWADIKSVLCNVRRKSICLSFPPRTNGWRLSVAEWNVIKPIMTRGYDHKNTYLQKHPRSAINAIVEKLGSGRSWQQVAVQTGMSYSCLIFSYEVLRADGRWGDICSALHSLRGSV